MEQVLSHLENVRVRYELVVSEQLWNICVHPKQNVSVMRLYAHCTQKKLDLRFFPSSDIFLNY